MRTISTLAAVLVTGLPGLFAQINVGGTPYSLQHGIGRADVPTVQAGAFDAKAAADDDAARDAMGMIPLYARFVQVNAGLENAGTWQTLPNGDRFWQLRIESKGALATELYFSDFHMPANAVLFVYDDEGQNVLGGFTSYNNHPSGLFATALVPGEACVVEYYEPATAAGQGHFFIDKMGHAYRFMGEAKAQDCEVDVNCSEGTSWFDERDGVVRLGVVEPGGAGWCSGSVVNNLQSDCKPYILTAFHCGVNSTTSNFTQWKAYFRYQRTGCETGVASTSKSMTGCVKRGDSNDGGGNTGSDFLLIEMDDPIPNNYIPYFNGWNANNTASPNGVCIHHPNGDEKKISTYTASTVNSTWGGTPGTHWRVNWTGTANGWGVTEGGSSGSPLFNSSGHIIGTLTGGGSYCNSVVPGGQNQPDYYGKVSYHWNSNSGAATEHLEEWLDPNGTGLKTMGGSYDPCGQYSDYVGLQENEPAASTEVFPNPASEAIHVVVPEGVTSVQRVEVLDVTGRMAASFAPEIGMPIVLYTSGWSAGTYVVRLVADGVTYAGTPVVVSGR